MRKTVEVAHSLYGRVELDVDKIIAVVPGQYGLLFEDVKWYLSEEDYWKVYKAWRE